MPFILFDLIYTVANFDFYSFYKGQKFISFVFYQIVKYYCNSAIIILIFCRENYCENSDNNENIFYIKTNIL